IVPVVKKNGSIRICGDYRSTVNTAIDMDAYPMPTTMDLFAKLANGKKFTRIDMARAYQQLHVDEATANLLTLNTHKGLYRMWRLAFGTKRSPGLFQRFMET